MLQKVIQALYNNGQIRFDKDFRHSLTNMAIADIQRHAGVPIWKLNMDALLADVKKQEAQKLYRIRHTVVVDFEGVDLECLYYYSPPEPSVGFDGEFHVEEIRFPSGCDAEEFLTEKARGIVEGLVLEKLRENAP